MHWYYFILALLAVWRITHLLQAEDGPLDLIFQLRKKLGNSFLGKLMDCFLCLSVWVALPFAFWLGETYTEILLIWPALSGAAILLDKFSNPQKYQTVATYYED